MLIGKFDDIIVNKVIYVYPIYVELDLTMSIQSKLHVSTVFHFSIRKDTVNLGQLVIY